MVLEVTDLYAAVSCQMYPECHISPVLVKKVILEVDEYLVVEVQKDSIREG